MLACERLFLMMRLALLFRSFLLLFFRTGKTVGGGIAH
jgi:hypothetical protein